ncbi:hypothetical protein QA648_00460 [Rhizobium sp. CB3171]|uniref:hypothetical protein n=1 Tax=Rhizobium sp. CB3171 TaxID=3039157 RepID=UPI0024B14CC7|nr:hypothetical protein [Rhizobium sp. CB3171]WFU02291.1 hypothetical protein QA648_00460 [Rhizobium sp. CB3171]
MDPKEFERLFPSPQNETQGEQEAPNTQQPTEQATQPQAQPANSEAIRPLIPK